MAGNAPGPPPDSVGESHKGKLLVASPLLVESDFHRTVILVLEHGEPGAVGVVLNRPSETDLLQPLPAWWDRAAPPSVVFVGGPMKQTAAICLGIARAEVDDLASAAGWQPVLGNLGVVDLNLTPEEVPVERLRVFAGYAGWESGQLEGEIDAGAWFVVDGTPRDAVDSAPEGLWRNVLRRQRRPELAMVSTYPLSPSLN